jgi:hypothetical protein
MYLNHRLNSYNYENRISDKNRDISDGKFRHKNLKNTLW